MQILLNGQVAEIEASCSIAGLLRQLDLQHQRLAVEVNQTIVPRSQFSEYQLTAADKVEIVRAIGGG